MVNEKEKGKEGVEEEEKQFANSLRELKHNIYVPLPPTASTSLPPSSYSHYCPIDITAST